MTENDDRLIVSFFETHRQEPLPDNGFSERVMRHLPSSTRSRQVVRSRIWTTVCVLTGIIALAVSGIGNAEKSLNDTFGHLLEHALYITGDPYVLLHYMAGLLALCAVAIYLLLDADHEYRRQRTG